MPPPLHRGKSPSLGEWRSVGGDTSRHAVRLVAAARVLTCHQTRSAAQLLLVMLCAMAAGLRFWFTVRQWQC